MPVPMVMVPQYQMPMQGMPQDQNGAPQQYQMVMVPQYQIPMQPMQQAMPQQPQPAATEPEVPAQPETVGPEVPAQPETAEPEVPAQPETAEQEAPAQPETTEQAAAPQKSSSRTFRYSISAPPVPLGLQQQTNIRLFSGDIRAQVEAARREYIAKKNEQ